jgi:hypothetical protein
MERYAYFIQINRRNTDLAGILFIPDVNEFFPEETIQNLTPQDIWVRRERQTFRRLPTSNSVVFTVHTSLKLLIDLDHKHLAGLAKEIRGWDENMAEYRRKDIWGECVLGFCDRSARIVDV